jgi:HPt (histidine-containing phosphotransfer) domain-containing protein
MPKRSWCPHPTVSAPELDALVWADVVSLLSDPELLLSAWQEQHQIDKKTDLSEEELRRLKHQISDGKSQCRRLLDAYQKQAIELEEFVSRRTAIEQRLESIQRTIDDLAGEPKQGLSFVDLERNIGEVCCSLSGRLQGMDMNGRMSLCRDLIDKVVVDNYNVEIHYKFPVSGNSNTKRERPPLLVQELLPLHFMRPEAHPPSGGVPRRRSLAVPAPPTVRLDNSQSAARLPSP